MIEVEIRNFQSIEHVRVRLDGFTALVGRSNLGKSAIVRAVKAALTGAPEEAHVRHGPTCERLVKQTKSCKCFCSVHIKTEGLDLLWEKGGDKNEYLFNGVKKTAVGKGTPDFLEEAFGPVKIGDRKVLIQVADQFRHEGGGPIFLLDEGGATVADVLSDVAQLDRINVASRMAEKDRKEAVSQRKVREKDVLDLKVQLLGYEGLDAVLARVREVEAGERQVAEQRAKRDHLARMLNSSRTIVAAFKALAAASALVVPEIGPVAGERAKLISLAKFIVALTERQGTVAELLGVEGIVVPEFTLKATWEAFQRSAGWLVKLRFYKELFAKAKGLEGAIVPEFEGLSKESKRALLLAGLTLRHTSLEATIGRLELALATADMEFAEVLEEQQALGACPTCAQPIDLPHDHAAE